MSAATGIAPDPVFGHLLALTDHRATYEHAVFAEPRSEHGYCTDDMARVLVVATREPRTPGVLNGLAGKALTFLNDAQCHDGGCRNRMDAAGNWTDRPSTGDAWGRCLWALGTAAAYSDVSMVRRLAAIQFDRTAKVRSPHPRAMAFAAIGAAELLGAVPGQPSAMSLLTDYATTTAEPTRNPDWPWPEPRLTYANAVLPEAMIAAGVTLGERRLTERGLELLEWLLDRETRDGHFSPTPVGGRGPQDATPAFDQQPIEIATMADACARAATIDPRPLWPAAIRTCAAWFLGDNDAGQLMWDPDTGGGFDGLHADGVNLNQGAESTLAVISTFQQARRFSVVAQ